MKGRRAPPSGATSMPPTKPARSVRSNRRSTSATTPSGRSLRLENDVGQERRRHRQQRPHHPAEHGRQQRPFDRRRRKLSDGAIPLPPPERAHDQRRELSYGIALRPP